jgi:tetratricopeptide (TPR) repeat protein
MKMKKKLLIVKEISLALAMILLFYGVACAGQQLDLVQKGIKHYNEHQYDDAISAFTEAIAQKGTMLSTAYSLRGLAYSEKGLYALALEDMTKAINLQSNKDDAAANLPSSYASRGVVYYKMGNLKLAAADFRMAAKLEPENISYAEWLDKIDEAQFLRMMDEAEFQRMSEAEAEFQREAQRYREMAVKPALPEDVQRCRIMAEDAFKNKDFEKALEYYRKGLTIEPLWPLGQFNAAYLAGELHWYNWAALYMKRYLELVPDAKNAKAAREEMYLWEGKGKELGTHPIKPPAAITQKSAATEKLKFGVAINKTNLAAANILGMKEPKGVIVLSVVQDSVAFSAGLKQDDAILKYGDKIISDKKDLQAAVAETMPGSTIPVTIWRKGRGEMVISAQFQSQKAPSRNDSKK